MPAKPDVPPDTGKLGALRDRLGVALFESKCEATTILTQGETSLK